MNEDPFEKQLRLDNLNAILELFDSQQSKGKKVWVESNSKCMLVVFRILDAYCLIFAYIKYFSWAIFFDDHYCKTIQEIWEIAVKDAKGMGWKWGIIVITCTPPTFL